MVYARVLLFSRHMKSAKMSKPDRRWLSPKRRRIAGQDEIVLKAKLFSPRQAHGIKHRRWVMNHGYFARTLCWTARKSFPIVRQHTPLRSFPVQRHSNSASPVSIMATPNTQPEPVTISGKKYRPIREGLASILAPYRETCTSTEPKTLKKPKNNDEGDQAVFYNPIQQFNRDLSVLAILVYGEGAIITKQERFRQKSAALKKRKDKAKKKKNDAAAGGEEQVQTSSTDAPASGDNSRKRGREDGSSELLESDANVTNSKRQKTDEFDLDDEELEILELEGDNTTALLNTPEEIHILNRTEIQPGRSSSGSNEVNNTKQSNGTNGDPEKYPKRHGTPFTILDALSATGLRALRYAREIPFATNIIANDVSPEAVKSIELNIDHNGVGEIVHSNVDDARAYMYSKVGNEKQAPSGKYIHRFDVIDLDPYGTAAPFFDSALQSLQDGGLLCVTCTDAGVFASNGYPEKAFALYGGISLKGAHSHEGGLRLILHAIATSAAKYGIAIEPLLSLSIDFYARLFVRIHKKQQDVKLLAGTTMLVYSCDHGCGAWTTQLLVRNQAKESKYGEAFFKHSFAQAPNVTPNCEHCGSKTHLGGPMWAGPLHNPYFVQRILDKLPTADKEVYCTTARLQGMLTVALEEDLTLPTNSTELPPSPPDTKEPSSKPAALPSPVLIPRSQPAAVDPSPFFFIPNYLAKVLHCTTPSEDQLRGAIRHLGYRVTRSHCKPGSFRTTAPWCVIWEIFREFVRTQKPIKEGAVKEGTAGWAILGGMRGSGRKKAGEMKDELERKLDKVDNLEEVRTVLESALFRLQNMHGEPAMNGNASKNSEGDAGGANCEGAAEVSGRADSPFPLPASKLNIVFDEQLGKEKDRGKLVRYQINPRANWGPMNRAGGA
jgi:tRNA (guanine26-N2/guanine27-N2)-dimethyltransferase